MLAVAVVAIVVGSIVHKVTHPTVKIGSYTYTINSSYVRLDGSQEEITPALVREIAKLENVTTFYFSQTPVTGELIAAAQENSQINSIEFSNCTFPEGTLSVTTLWPELKHLALYNYPDTESAAAPFSLEFLRNMPNLTEAIFSNCNSDFAPLAACTGLTSINIQNCGLQDLSFCSGLSALRSLEVSFNSISDLSPLAGCGSLSMVYLDNNALTTLEGLNTLEGLVYLYAADNEIADISALAACTQLYHIDLENNQVSDLSPLAGLTELRLVAEEH